MALSTETPPRAWGRQRPDAIHRRDTGNTPTCVGKTHHKAHQEWTAWKHPHVRGEDPAGRPGGQTCRETPPRAWGRPTGEVRRARQVRNTPTCVGKTRSGRRATPRWRKHPHVRGEDRSSLMIISRLKETPPRAWGRRHFQQAHATVGGNTPTCVGKTAPGAHWRQIGWKHPHVRGED